MPLPPRQHFKLPTAVTVVFRRDRKGGVDAHVLDFDIVTSGADRAEAYFKIRAAIMSYVETGFLNEWADDIRYPAAAEYWPAPGVQLEVGDPIHIMSQNLVVYSASSIANEHRETHSLA
jgi:hypothetical protein